MECIDYEGKDAIALEAFLELGVATINFRRINLEKTNYQTLAETIEAQHIITTEFKDIIEET